MSDKHLDYPVWITRAAGLLLAYLGIHEWVYYDQHAYTRGPSGILAAGFLASAVMAFAVAYGLRAVGDVLNAHVDGTSTRALAQLVKAGELNDDPLE